MLADMSVMPSTDVSSTEDLLDTFYKVLVILWKVCPDKQNRILCEGRKYEHVKTAQSPFEHDWKQFLDHLCWLLDNDKGGKTVASIAVALSGVSPLYSPACNREPSAERVKHLEAILALLSRVDPGSSQSQLETVNEILGLAYVFSGKAVKNYVMRLSRFLKEAQEANLNVEAFSSFQKPQTKDLAQICETAYRFYKEKPMRELRRQSREIPKQRAIHHVIGRLGSWRRTAQVLVEFVVQYPQAVQNYKIRWVPTRRVPKIEMDNQSLITSVHDISPPPGLSALNLRDLLDCSDLKASLSDAIRESRSDSRIHAEIQVAEHFFLNDLKFWQGIRYIGCSKPSCYCCDEYLRRHPGMFDPRPCHGNVYPKWRPPNLSNNASGFDQAHTEILLRAMIDTMQHDVCECSGQPVNVQRRTPDSVTGITSTKSPPPSVRRRVKALALIPKPVKA